jgi:L-ribulose-5-phosphate 4-epimerase
MAAGSAIDGCGSAIDGCGSAIDGCGSATNGCDSAIDGCDSAIGEPPEALYVRRATGYQRRTRMHDEGVIKFTARHEQRRLEPRTYGELACTLTAWREIFSKTELVGQDPARYGGAGYGNVSGRVQAPSAPRGQRAFLVTGTQTGGERTLSLEQYCVVTRYEERHNRVDSFGAIAPSSESMTHGAIYDLSPHIRFVFHAHTPVIWQRAAALRLPTTRPEVPYGTPEMAREMYRLYTTTPLPELRILAMGGHEDGIIVFGKTAEEAGEVMLRHLARAYGMVCAAR